MNDPFIGATGGLQSEKRRLYGILSDDMEAGAVELGGEAAREAAEAASGFNKEVMRRLKAIEHPAKRRMGYIC